MTSITISPRLVALLSSALALPAMAQTSNVDSVNKFSWGENIGWMNWHDAGSPVGAQGVFLQPGFLSGFIWCENVGWINLGDGTPANGTSYANVTGADFGVNLDVGTGFLSGMAWGENIGWVNFAGGSIAAGSGSAARLDAAAGRLRGYAWSENVGWINLNDSNHYVGYTCPTDWNCDGFVDGFDYDDFVTAFEGGALPPCRTSADFNGDNFVDGFDYDDFVTAFEAGC